MNIALALIAFAVAANSPRRTYDLAFYAGEKIDSHTNVIERGGDSACGGEIVMARVKSMPDDDDALVSDEIQELTGKGSVVRTWRVPLEANPVGISGSTLYVVNRRALKTETLGITFDGDIRDSATLSEPREGAYSRCPENKLHESGYRWCVKLYDREFRKDRLIAFEGPCT